MDGRKPFVYDKPKIITQKFKVDLPDQMRIHVTRKEVIRQLHNMGCTDGLPDDYEDSMVSYEVTQEPTMENYQIAINEVEKEIKKTEKKK